MRLLLLGLFVLTTSACNDAGTNPFLYADAGMQPDASTEDCLGCLSNGQCVNGDSAAACGTGGQVCTQCENAQVCDETGQCAEAPSCTRDSCDGCCDAAGTCRTGDEPDACGNGGLACATCGAGESCPNGLCRPPCGPDTCSGCCTPAGECVFGNVDTECGAAGNTCADCSATSASCSSGQCVSTACADSCAGCCDGSTCIEPQSDSQCGNSGDACIDCGVGRTCAATGCEVAADSVWTITIASAEIAATDPAGDSWDGFNGLPDPFVTVLVTDPVSGELSNSTTIVDDSLTPQWNEEVLTSVSGEALFGGMTLQLRDSDTAFDDEICDISVSLNPTSAEFDGGLFQVMCAEATLLFRLTPAP